MRMTEAEYRWLQLTRQRTAEGLPEPSEKVFLGDVYALMKTAGWLVYHTHDSRRSPEGFPDLVGVKPGRPVLFAELKTATGKLTVAQHRWVAFLQHAVGCQVYVWRPRDWPQIVEVLTR